MTLTCPSMMQILAVLVSTLALAASRDVPDGQCNQDGLCLGNFLDETSFDFETTAENRVACINFCRVTPKCFWYSLDMNSGMCIALEDCPQLDKSMTKPAHFISGNKDCSKYTCNKSGRCQGTLIDAYPHEDANTCLEDCQSKNHPDCHWFTYFPQDEACILLADCSDELLPCSDCFSGQRQCEEMSPTRNKLMIGREHFELIDLSDSSKPNCPLPDYPIPSAHPAFMTFDEEARLVRACGSSAAGGSNKCFTFDGFKWEENMESTRSSYSGDSGSGSAFLSYNFIGWWIFEGSNSSEVYSSTRGSWESGPSLVVSDNSDYFPAQSSCTTQLNKTHTMLILGGAFDPNSSYGVSHVLLYDHTDSGPKVWTYGSPMQSGRVYHSCTSFGEGKVMVSGGIDFYGNSFNTTEIYDPEIDSWYYSQDMPTNGKLSVWNDNPLLIDRENIWKFEDGKWNLLESKPTDYSYHGWYQQKFAFTLPDDFIPDC